MTHLLKRRHLSPIYGGRVAMSPGERDLLLIEDVPDIFHCGHVHTLGIGRYSGTLIVNSAGWQEQTSFQRERNIEPDVAKFPVIDLESMGIKILDFGG
jgi:DNA polymerase II small subunit